MPRREEIPKIIGIAIAKSPKLVLKISWRYLKAKKRAQRAEAIFIKKMQATGMDRESAEKLAERYTSTVSLRYLLKEIGVPAIALNGKKSNDNGGNDR